jgi:hypothetical protein
MKLRKMFSALAIALIPLTGLVQGCADDSDTGVEAVTQQSSYDVNIAAFNELYPDRFPVQKPADGWTALVQVGDKILPAPTHLFGDVVNIIPYSNEDGVKDADGKAFEYGDQEIAKYYAPGVVGIALKMHRPEKRFIDLNDADASAMKEDFKLQDTHIEVVVGVDRAEHGKPGAITLNNPQGYEEGRFGNPTYSMIFLEPVYPSFVGERQAEYNANVRLALVGFNAVTNFPGDYNGGDPLGGRNPQKVQEYVDQMVRAIAGDEDARAWFTQTENLVYCAELAFLSFSAGLIDPLNKSTMAPRVGEDVWEKFVDQVELHNKGVDEYAQTGTITKPSNFVLFNDNKRVALVRLELADEDLEPIAALSPDPAAYAKLLALEPMTMSDIVEQFMRTHIPREKLGEQLAPVQGAVLAKMKPGLLETMAMDQLPADDPKRVAVEQLFDAIVQVVGKSYSSYDAFRAALEPLLAQARMVTGPRGDTGEGLFVPPSLFHVAAQGKQHALLGFGYLGHGVHVSAVSKKAGAQPEPTPVDDIPTDVSCRTPLDGAEDSCGSQAAGGCWCDAECSTYGDCCADYKAACGN